MNDETQSNPIVGSMKVDSSIVNPPIDGRAAVGSVIQASAAAAVDMADGQLEEAGEGSHGETE